MIFYEKIVYVFTNKKATKKKKTSVFWRPVDQNWAGVVNCFEKNMLRNEICVRNEWVQQM